MIGITLPHLRGTEAAPFLAALGVLSLVTNELDDPSATLGWPDGPRGAARLTSQGLTSVGDLAEALKAVATRMIADDELLPGAGPGFPPRKQGSAPDPTRSIHRDSAQVWATNARAAHRSRPWLAGVVATNDVTTPKDRNSPSVVMGRNPLFDAGPGTVSVSTTLTNNRDQAAAGDNVARALTTGLRQGGSIGGYLDWRADRDAADLASRRDPSNYGDPVVAWLAFMGLRVAPLVTINGTTGSSLCRPGRIKGLRKPLVWPVWRHDLTFDAVVVLLAHPAIDPRALIELATPPPAAEQPAEKSAAEPAAGSKRRRSSAAPSDRLHALGVTDVFAASRLSKGNNDGAYGPARRLWPVVEPAAHV